MQRRSGGARVDRSGGVPGVAPAAAARPRALRSQPADQLQAGLMSQRPVPDFYPRRLRGGARGVAVSAMLAMLALALGLPSPASAALEIEVTSGVRDPVPIAIVPFTPLPPADGGLDVAALAQPDLERSGRVRALPRERMPAKPTRADEIVAGSWKGAGSDYVVVGRVSASGSGDLAVDFDLVNALTGARLATQRFVGAPSALRNAAHRVSDVVYQKILGGRGAFATRIAYVAVDGEAPSQNYQLVVADADGENQRLVLQSRLPL